MSRGLDHARPRLSRAGRRACLCRSARHRGPQQSWGGTGRRVDRVTYVFERGGAVELPSAAQPWWDLASGTAKLARAAGATIDVAAAPPSEAANGGPSRAWLLAAGAGAVLLVIAGAAIRHLTRRPGPAAGRAEREAFAALRRAGPDARALYRAFSRWQSFLDPATGRRAAEAAVPLDAALLRARRRCGVPPTPQLGRPPRAAAPAASGWSARPNAAAVEPRRRDRRQTCLISDDPIVHRLQSGSASWAKGKDDVQRPDE